MRLKDVKIGTKLMGGFVIVLALVTLQSLYTMVQAARINAQSTTLANHWMPSATLMGGASDMISRLRSTQFQHLLNRNPAEKTALAGQMDKLVSEVSRRLTEFSQLPLDDAQRQSLTALEADWKTYQSQQKELVQLSSTFQEDAANELMTGPALKTYETLSGHLGKLIDMSLEGGRQASGNGDGRAAEGQGARAMACSAREAASGGGRPAATARHISPRWRRRWSRRAGQPERVAKPARKSAAASARSWRPARRSPMRKSGHSSGVAAVAWSYSAAVTSWHRRRSLRRRRRQVSVPVRENVRIYRPNLHPVIDRQA